MRIPADSWLRKTPVAHRGLWTDEIPENSIPAYENAIAHGYAIEIDVYMTTDGEIIVIHDSELTRLTGVNGKTYEKSYAEISKLTILGTEEKIPTLKEVLSVVDGKVPLLIEIKNGQSKNTVDKVVEILSTYHGEFAIQSFDPTFINRVKKLAPHFIRGVLGSPDLKETTKFKAWIVEKMPLNFLCKPDFISYYHKAFPLKKRKAKNKVVIAWTITSKQDYEKVKEFTDNIIFEKFTPTH